MSETMLTIGKITGVHGLAGNLKVWSYANALDTFSPGRQVKLQDEGAGTGTNYTITGASPSKKGVRLSLAGVTSREASEALVGKQILIDKAQLPELDENTWYWEDLIGLRVIDRDLEFLGTIDHLFSTGADDILVIKNDQKTENQPEASEVLIPMNAHFVIEVDIEAGTVTTALPQGFLTL